MSSSPYLPWRHVAMPSSPYFPWRHVPWPPDPTSLATRAMASSPYFPGDTWHGLLPLLSLATRGMASSPYFPGDTWAWPPPPTFPGDTCHGLLTLLPLVTRGMASPPLAPRVRYVIYAAVLVGAREMGTHPKLPTEAQCFGPRNAFSLPPIDTNVRGFVRGSAVGDGSFGLGALRENILAVPWHPCIALYWPMVTLLCMLQVHACTPPEISPHLLTSPHTRSAHISSTSCISPSSAAAVAPRRCTPSHTFSHLLAPSRTFSHLLTPSHTFSAAPR